MKKSFTLVELMIVILIIVFLTSIAIPRMRNLIRKARESSTKGNLGVLRSALNIYYAEKEGIYPTNLTQALMPRYINIIPYAYIPDPHNQSSNSVYIDVDNNISNDDMPAATENNGQAFAFWWYSLGQIKIACTHNDLSGVSWTVY
ncbi:MAG: type II secretion system GspH family protein [bacterium]|nr:type II secretion system GspH family protein [bacterium]